MVTRALVLGGLLAASGAAAQSRRRPPELPFSVGARLGVQWSPWAPQLPAPTGSLRVGYQLPVLGRRFEVFADVGYVAPRTWVPTAVRDWSVALGLTFWLVEPVRRVAPYVSAAPRLHLLDVVQPPWSEGRTRLGGSFAVGVGFRIGVGRLLLESAVEVLWLDSKLTGPTDLTAIAQRLGYAVSW